MLISACIQFGGHQGVIDAKFLKKMWCSVGEGYYKISSIQLKNRIILSYPSRRNTTVSDKSYPFIVYCVRVIFFSLILPFSARCLIVFILLRFLRTLNVQSDASLALKPT